MERYSEYKDSGVKWLGEIPSHWEVRKIIGSFSENKKKNTNFTYTHAMQFNYGTIVDKNERFDTNEAKSIYSNYALINKGDIVINGLNLNYDFISQRVAISPKDGIITSAYVVVSPRENMNPYYFCYLFKDMDNMKMFHGMGSGVRKTLSFKELRNQLIPIPTVEEQDAIVSYLDAATSKIDKAIAMQQKMIDLLNERKQIIIQNAVTKGLDDKVEMKDSGVEWIGMIPKHWEILKLKRCAFIKTGTTPPTNERKYFEGGCISWFTPGDMNNMHLEFASKMITQKAIDDKVGRLFPAKTIYFVGIGATVAKVSACDFEASSNQQINAIICNKSLDYRFATYVLKSEQEFIRNMANYVTLPIINQSDTGLIDMIVPPKSEQQAIVAYLDKQMQRFDSAISNCQRQISLLQERKQIIINEVVTGKVKVS